MNNYKKKNKVTSSNLRDKNGTPIKLGDVVNHIYGYQLIVKIDTNCQYYGKLVCHKGHSCENVPYALYSDEIEKVTIN